MNHLKPFKFFESEITSKLTPGMMRLADSMMSEVNVVVETDVGKMSEWVIEQGLQRAADEYLDSDEFREFTEASVEETDEYRERVQSGEDPEKVLQQLTDKAVSDQTYWSEFLEDGGYEAYAMEEIQDEINYLPQKGKSHFFDESSRWTEVPGQPIPTIDIEGSAYLTGYEKSFLPFRIRNIEMGNFLPGDVNQEFQTDYVESVMGELSIYRTNLISLDKGPINVEWGFYISDNPRLISLEGIRDFNEIEIDDNFLDELTLKKSIDLSPGTKESIEYYLSLLQMSEFSQFDEEQIQFVFERIGHQEGIQRFIDENPEKMAVALKSNWKRIKSMGQFKDLRFPESLSGEVNLLSNLDDIGL
jgi:hypothetical protein